MQELMMQRKSERIDMLNKELERIKEGLISLGAEKIIIFGSAARGELSIFSDLDIVVIMDTEMDFIERLRFVYKRLKPRSADILIYTPEEVEDEANVFVRTALEEGEIVYEEKVMKKKLKDGLSKQKRIL